MEDCIHQAEELTFDAIVGEQEADQIRVDLKKTADKLDEEWRFTESDYAYWKEVEPDDNDKMKLPIPEGPFEKATAGIKWHLSYDE